MSHSARSAMCGAKSKRGVRPAAGRRVESRSGLVVPLLPEAHCHLVGAGLGSSFTHLIHVLSPAGVAGGIDIGTIVRRCHAHYAITVGVDVSYGPPAPAQTPPLYSFPLALP